MFIRHFAARLFGGQIMHAAQRLPFGVRRGAGFQPRDAEIRHLDPAFAVHQNVLGLDIAMYNAVPVRVIHRRQNANRHAQRHIGVNAPLLPDHFL